MSTRTETLGGIFRSWLTRLWVLGAAAAAFYQFGCDQFDWPKLPVLWGATGVFVPWWGWLILAQFGFTYGLFEYVRRTLNSHADDDSDGDGSLSKREKKWANLKENIEAVATSIGFALGAGGAFRYRSALAQAEGLLLRLSEQNEFQVPELRGDGEKIGCMRALIYLTDLTPLLLLDDDVAARTRAAELSVWLNNLDEAALEKLVKLENEGSYFG